MCNYLLNKQSLSQFFYLLQCSLINRRLLRELLRLRVLGLFLFDQLTLIAVRKHMPPLQTILQGQQRDHSTNGQRKYHPNNDEFHIRTLFLHCEVRLAQIYLNWLVYISQPPQICPLLKDYTNNETNKQWIWLWTILWDKIFLWYTYTKALFVVAR